MRIPRGFLPSCQRPLKVVFPSFFRGRFRGLFSTPGMPMARQMKAVVMMMRMVGR